MSTDATDLWEDIRNCSFETDSKSKGGDETCDILQDYQWTLDTFEKRSNNVIDIPHCYAVEYFQTQNSTVMNLINSFNALTSIPGQAYDDIGKYITELYNSIMNARNEPEPEQGKNKANSAATTSTAATATTTTGQNAAPAQTAPNNKTEEDDKSSWGTVQKIMGGMKDNITKFYNKHISSILKDVTNPAAQSEFLKPYKYLYWLTATKKQYVFPMVATPPSYTLSNSYGQENGKSQGRAGLFAHLSNISDVITSAAHTGLGFIRDAKDLMGMFNYSSANVYYGTEVEKAQFFQYPQNGEEYTIQFPLINTVKSSGKEPTWKKNYRFIFLFILRNMIYRRNNNSFYPPLFYDLIIPGVIRQPFTYVSSVSIVPMGNVKMKSFDYGFLINDAKNKSYSVCVPEQWHVTIKFKSLLASSGNLVLSSLHDLSIKSTSAETNAN